MTAPHTHEVVLRRTFNAPRERVFQAWTDPDLLKIWLGGQHTETKFVSVDFRVGGIYQVDVMTGAGEFQRLSGMYQEIDAPNKLVFTWTWGDINNVDDATLVTVVFHDIDGKTDIVLRHERFDDIPTRNLHAEGWEMCFNRLVKLLA